MPTQTQVILVAGVRNLAWPEVHLPAWLDTGATLDLAQITSSDAYRPYLTGSFQRYAASPLLYAWQIENEPLDNTNEALGEVALEGATVADEVALLKSIDPIHRAIVTTYNSASVSLDMQAASTFSWFFDLLPGPEAGGHPKPALLLGDILGLDIYVATPSTPLEDASVTERIGWKAATLTYWANQGVQSGKEVWVTEMQGSTWNGEPGFSPEDLLESAQQYSGTGVSAVLLWGVEDWLSVPELDVGRADGVSDAQELTGRRSSAAAILAFVAVAALLGGWGIGFGLPFDFRPDEELFTGRAVQMAVEHSLDPHFYVYPPLGLYLFALAEWVLGLVAPSHLGPATSVDPSWEYLAARLVSVLAFAATTGLVGLVGRAAYGALAGVVAAACFALAPLAVQNAHFGRVDLLALALMVLAMWPGGRAHSRAGWALGGRGRRPRRGDQVHRRRRRRLPARARPPWR